MFSQLPPHQTAFIDRMKGRERSAQSASVGRQEIDMIAQTLTELFQRNGVNIEQEQHDDGITLTIKYPNT